MFTKMTSFGNRSLQQRWGKQKPWWKDYLPIEPCPVNPTQPGIQLQLIGQPPMRRKASYVKVRKTYNVHVSLLDRYNQKYPANHFQLDKVSFSIVLSKVPYATTAEPLATHVSKDQTKNPPLSTHHPNNHMFTLQVHPSSSRSLLVSPSPYSSAAYQSIETTHDLSANARQYGTANIPKIISSRPRALDLERQDFLAPTRPGSNNRLGFCRWLVCFLVLFCLGLILAQFYYV
jgi:hypothetical protein